MREQEEELERLKRQLIGLKEEEAEARRERQDCENAIAWIEYQIRQAQDKAVTE